MEGLLAMRQVHDRQAAHAAGEIAVTVITGSIGTTVIQRFHHARQHRIVDAAADFVSGYSTHERR